MLMEQKATLLLLILFAHKFQRASAEQQHCVTEEFRHVHPADFKLCQPKTHCHFYYSNFTIRIGITVMTKAEFDSNAKYKAVIVRAATAFSCFNIEGPTI